jgi:membrane protein implicated in regulation of membrane protease activity/transcriptional regulator with XRE-family HTH domain
MAFGERLQAVRRRNEMTQVEFAAQLKVSRQAVSKWESSRGYPEIEKIIYICNRYGTTMDELFADEVPTVRQEEASPDIPQELQNRPLKTVLSDFFANLSMTNKLMIGGLLAAIALLVLLISHNLKGGTDYVMTIVWTAASILFGVVEAVTAGLVCIWFVAGALVALVASLLGAPLWLQVTVFLTLSSSLLACLRPFVRKFIKPKVVATNVDSVIGSHGYVTEQIDNLSATGQVKLGGMVWSARSTNGQVIHKDAKIVVDKIEGVKVFVSPV